jgi:flagellin-like hook-associated protein FlgL
MAIGYVGSISSSMLQSIIDMRTKLDDLQRQLGSGQKSTTYAGLGLGRGISLSLHSQLSAIQGYDTTIANVGVRLSLAQSTLSGIDTIAHTVKTSTYQSPFSIDQDGQTAQQKAAFSQLDQLTALLNTRAGDRYLFSGKAVDRQSVANADQIVNGDGVKAGLKQLISERQQADLGNDGLGRLDLTQAGTVVGVAEDAVSPFGVKLAGVATTMPGATVTGPGGSPAALSVDLGPTNPSAGDTLTLSFNLPDGSTQSITLTATNASPPGDNEFTIGANSTATAVNLNTALQTSVGQLAATSLSAASAMAAANDFFFTVGTHPPQRVNGPPFDTAKSLVNGTAANTVMWYTGDDGSDPARGTATAQADPSVTVSYGMRANEQALRLAVQNIAVFAAVSYTPTDPNAENSYKALTERVAGGLDGSQGQQKVSDIESEIASAQTAFSAAKTRHQQTSNQITDLLQGIEGVSQEEVGTQILSMQTSLQASLQTTALLAQMSLVNFLK